MQEDAAGVRGSRELGVCRAPRKERKRTTGDWIIPFPGDITQPTSVFYGTREKQMGGHITKDTATAWGPAV